MHEERRETPPSALSPGKGMDGIGSVRSEDGRFDGPRKD